MQMRQRRDANIHSGFISSHVAGHLSHEKTTPQNVTFNIELAVQELSQEAPSQIEDVVCYEKIVNKIKTLVAAHHFDFC